MSQRVVCVDEAVIRELRERLDRIEKLLEELRIHAVSASALASAIKELAAVLNARKSIDMALVDVMRDVAKAIRKHAEVELDKILLGK